MRIAGNKVKHLLDFYLNELQALYEASEIEALFGLACEHFLGYGHNAYKTNLDANLNQSDLLKLYDCGKALQSGQPIQYVLGEAWFYERKFKVSPAVLIPRPETEELVELIIKREAAAESILDIGTGSGCIAITLALALKNTAVSACDISQAALHIASENAKNLNAELTFVEQDILHENAAEKFKRQFSVLVSNPPYILSSEKKGMQEHVIAHEPHLALFVEGTDEILFYRSIITHCKTLLQAQGALYFELNPLTALQVKEYALQSSLFSEVAVLPDMSGKQRFLRAVRK